MSQNLLGRDYGTVISSPPDHLKLDKTYIQYQIAYIWYTTYIFNPPAVKAGILWDSYVKTMVSIAQD